MEIKDQMVLFRDLPHTEGQEDLLDLQVDNMILIRDTNTLGNKDQEVITDLKLTPRGSTNKIPIISMVIIASKVTKY